MTHRVMTIIFRSLQCETCKMQREIILAPFFQAKSQQTSPRPSSKNVPRHTARNKPEIAVRFMPTEKPLPTVQRIGRDPKRYLTKGKAALK